jgi:hypothetical protein
LATLEEFLRDNNVKDSNEKSVRGPAAQYKSIPCVILSANETEVLIGYYGVKYIANRADIVAVDAPSQRAPNPFGAGVQAQLTIRKKAILKQTRKIKLSEITETIPFAISRPSHATMKGITTSSQLELERNWLLAHGIVPEDATIHYTDTQSSQMTATKTTTEMDDSKVDDTPSDNMGSDDSSPDSVDNDGDDDDDDDDD